MAARNLRHPWQLVGTFMLAWGLSSCAAGAGSPMAPVTFQPGLSNARALNKTAQEHHDDQYDPDVVANGMGSCPRSGRVEDDPLPGRLTHCPALAPSNSRVSVLGR